ncbi:hypothetical protein GCM10023351_21320 [Microbacterium gilvum]|uniref:Uncharacterized protein n=1 Tax=Microbacterium gilvum TaxID=1336204 RepID=A0ABP9A944_9MICO
MSIVPITLRGSRRPLESRAGVPTGPHPPPPEASRNPPTIPSGARNASGRGLSLRRFGSPFTVKRTRMYAPSASRMPLVTGAAASVESPDRNVAPAKAPTAPGTPIFSTVFQSTLPKRQCEMPEASVVPISARCTDALAAAGAAPIVSSSVVDVTPYAMPRAPSTSWAAKPITARRTSVCMPTTLGCSPTGGVGDYGRP